MESDLQMLYLLSMLPIYSLKLSLLISEHIMVVFLQVSSVVSSFLILQDQVQIFPRHLSNHIVLQGSCESFFHVPSPQIHVVKNVPLFLGDDKLYWHPQSGVLYNLIVL